MEKEVIAQQRGKGGHSGASWKKLDMAQQRGKGGHSGAS